MSQSTILETQHVKDMVSMLVETLQEQIRDLSRDLSTDLSLDDTPDAFEADQLANQMVQTLAWFLLQSDEAPAVGIQAHQLTTDHVASFFKLSIQNNVFTPADEDVA